MNETRPVYYHDCPVLGPHTIVTEAVMLSDDKTVVLKRQHKCVFCSYTAGDVRYARGVAPQLDGSYLVDMSIAERVE